MADSEKQEGGTAPKLAEVASVSAGILGQFFDALEKEADFAEVAPGLRKLVLEYGVTAEPAIKAALFPDAP